MTVTESRVGSRVQIIRPLVHLQMATVTEALPVRSQEPGPSSESPVWGPSHLGHPLLPSQGP